VSLPANAIEARRLVAVARRELGDAGMKGLSSDGAFEHGYNAALTVATLIVRVSGERIHGQDHHRLTFERLGQLAQGRWSGLANYLQHCRTRRNTVVYDIAGSISEAEATEVRKEAEALLNDVLAWIHKDHPELGL